MQYTQHNQPVVFVITCLIIGTGMVFTLFAQTTTNSNENYQMPVYDRDGALQLPPDYLRWTLVGTSLGLSYNEETPRRESFNHTLMEPTSYDYFVRTGEFREGTMLALLVRGTENDAMPARHGRFAADVFAVELAVKDSSRVNEGWAYYDFGGGNRARTTAQPFPKSQGCYTCHIEHAARDNVFLQFYPLLADAAGISVD